jgi:hypothetical protein
MMTDGHVAIEAMDLLLRNSARVSGSRVSEWLATRDPDVLSVVYEAVSKGRDRLDGGVSPDVYFDLVTTLFSTLLEKEGHSDYALSRYDAGRIFAAFLLQCAKEAATHPEQARLLRAGAAHLAVAYKAGNEAQRRCIVDGVVEHVFHDDTARSAFSEWARDPVLKGGYAEAADWGKE